MATESQTNLLPQTTTPDVVIENPLFVAARTGAPAQELIDLVASFSGVNALNEDGQTFLFTLQPSTFENLDHFLTLIKSLDKKDFTFGHLDHFGRNFLSLLATKAGFQMSCIQLAFRSVTCRCARQPPHETGCIHGITRRRDAFGKLLIDYLDAHFPHKDSSKVLDAYKWVERNKDPKEASADQTSMDVFNLCFPKKAYPSSKTRLQLHEEDDQGRTEAGVRIIATGEVDQKDGVDLKLELEHYDMHGETPLMGYFKTALDEKVEEEIIAEKLGKLVELGANVNARSRHGRTLLHFAAKRTWPVVMAKLLELGISTETRDESGLTALGYLEKPDGKSLSRLLFERRRRNICVELLQSRAQ